MKKKIYALFKVIAFLIILFISIEFVHNITKRKYSYEKAEDFLNQEEDFDALFFGTSHVMNGIFPMQLWGEYGIVSYNMGYSGERLAITYYNMLQALEQKKTNMVVIDVGFISYDQKMRTTTSLVHDSFDIYPLSYTKYLAIKDLFEGQNLLDKEIEYLFNFSMYHSRWKELEQDDFKMKSLYEKGAESITEINEIKPINNYDSIQPYEGEDNISIRYFRKIVEYCKKNDIPILITFLPYALDDYNVSFSKYVQSMCDEYDINYINFLDKNLVNYDIDFCDDDGHLNPSGARKVTKYIGEYIINNYNIQSKKDNQDYSYWNTDYNEYIDFKIKNLERNEGNLNNYLMLLYDEKDIKYEITISNKEQIIEGTQTYELLENLGNNYKINSNEFDENPNKNIKISTYDNRNGNLIKTIWF